ncbi:hypothetical protein EO98_18480 [Methanosarcina sp. 2.H.T.1A.6]|uniref:hypothetical protein n=1 Tax=unclassified Methanosarcina TaxID=2644672 RepID=UPI0006226F2F|nr:MULTISPECIES: hypothetical protein [unclassified Methanosarcina]KKG17060.1 hypothetical protein EO94_18415 [Methanosarcina sp. 2.H.T.1A.3]KKG20317.1 hypothetical protein EO98_18480 [Methanosarcina sp. 2.H.T.1A.6]KKG21126.1 hypothetical protein EO97_00665 [Methanosarcina sp. 2.H.T.1A.15]KKG23419.1 hypothetical protein EO96_17380 [Methanosarcina sp. 2.H.T.1A.8]
MIKKVANFIISFVITTIILLVYFYLAHGLPVAQELEKTNIVSVQIVQGNETINLTGDEDLEKAVNVVKVLNFRFGEANGGPADTTCTFYQRDGSKIEIGANNDTIFKNGKQYVGVNDSCRFFGNLIQGFFFSETLQDGKLYN